MIDVICVTGHQPNAPGARNAKRDLYEYQFNDPIVAEVVDLLKAAGIEAVHEHYGPGPDVDRWSGQSKLLVEFHCNAFNGKASGTEVLYAKGSAAGQKAAAIMQRHLVGALKLPNRGIKSKVRSDRGGYLVCGLSQTALIPEPFFIDNDADLSRANGANLARVYADAIAEILGKNPAARAPAAGIDQPESGVADFLKALFSFLR